MMAPPILPNQYLVYTGYVGPDQPTVTQTWLLPPNAVANGATPQQPLKLPFLYTGNGNLAALKQLSNDDFSIAAVYSGSPTPQNVSIGLQVTGKHAWSTGASARNALRANFLTLIQQIELQFEQNGTPALIAGASAMIAAAFTQILPLPIAETLLYACGLETGIGTGAAPAVNLQPGMRLRSEPSARQYLAPPNQGFSAYVASGTLSWNVSGNAGQAPLQQFDAFLGAIAGPQITPPPAAPVPINSLIDLQLAGSAYRYHRLIYPQNVIAANNAGNLTAQQNIQLLAANTLADLYHSPAATQLFFGRDLVVPEICVWLGPSTGNLTPLYVPLGTTVNHLLERFGAWKPLSTNDARNVTVLYRMVYSPSNQGSLSGVQISFAPQTASITDLRVLNLPLLPGDALLLNLPIP
ncbi:hypothetical protein [Duganella sp. S19_KUP01_CR8]|uniref:hypothetical protein n=1 Tax=Duganella sp. S19_KUP01_CR8 TaxID=3025502 RepID=UPI002FCD8CC7